MLYLLQLQLRSTKLCFITVHVPCIEVIVHTLDDNYSAPLEAAPAANVEPNTSIEDHESIVTSYKELIRDQVGLRRITIGSQPCCVHVQLLGH